MNNKYLLGYLMASILVFSLCSCMSTSKYASKVKKHANPAVVPPDFNPAKHVLLFAEIPRLNHPDERNNSVTSKLEKALKEYCPYKYEIVSTKDIYDKNGKYADTSIYKYAILNSLNSVWHTTTTTTTITDNTGRHTSSVSPSARTTYIDFNFYDRSNEQHYPNSGASTAHINYTVAGFMAIIKQVKGS